MAAVSYRAVRKIYPHSPLYCIIDRVILCKHLEIDNLFSKKKGIRSARYLQSKRRSFSAFFSRHFRHKASLHHYFQIHKRSMLLLPLEHFPHCRRNPCLTHAIVFNQFIRSSRLTKFIMHTDKLNWCRSQKR